MQVSCTQHMASIAVPDGVPALVFGPRLLHLIGASSVTHVPSLSPVPMSTHAVKNMLSRYLRDNYMRASDLEPHDIYLVTARHGKLTKVAPNTMISQRNCPFVI